MNRVVLSLGSNEGDRLEWLRQAVRELRSQPELSNVRTSPVYETAPVGYTDQAPFLNLALMCETELEPMALLRRCQSIEQALGRRREIRWGPRTVDIDIILYNELTLDSPELTLPHPRAHERAFVLIPLLDLEPMARIGSELASELLKKIPSDQWVRKYGSYAL